MTFALLLNLLALFFFVATTSSGATPSTGQALPPQPTNKPFYFHFSPIPASLLKLPVTGRKGLEWTPLAPTMTTNITSPNDNEDNDRNADRPQYQCLYQGSFVVVCQELEKCLKTPNRTEVTLPDNRTFSGYACNAPLVRKQYSAKNGIATRGFINVLKQNTKPLDVLFICHFFGHDLPAERSFTCSAPLDCRVRGAVSPCSGGIPWYGVWTGDLELGLWGVITAEAMESG